MPASSPVFQVTFSDAKQSHLLNAPPGLKSSPSAAAKYPTSPPRRPQSKQNAYATREPAGFPASSTAGSQHARAGQNQRPHRLHRSGLLGRTLHECRAPQCNTHAIRYSEIPNPNAYPEHHFESGRQPDNYRACVRKLRRCSPGLLLRHRTPQLLLRRQLNCHHGTHRVSLLQQHDLASW